MYMISLGGKAVTSSLPLSQEYFPHKANCCCIFLAAETLLLPIPRRRLLSAETCTPSRLRVLGLKIGSADVLGLGLTRSWSNGVWKNMLIISHSLLYFPCLPRLITPGGKS
ncbi:hypothetical protein V6N13_004970 [Hibiscus sabdariffa]